MDKYQWILKKRAKSLHIFQAVMAGLKKAEAQFRVEYENAFNAIETQKKSITQAQARIEEEQKAMEFLANEIQTTAAHHDKVASLTTV